MMSKLHMLRTHPLSLPEREAAVRRFGATLSAPAAAAPIRPIPGGVGYGVFFNAPFKTNFARGTAISWEIICPMPPGGNVTDWLYLTSTNRSALGVEAFIAYHGQNDTSFNVFDWARPEGQRWQTHVLFADLANYLTTDSANGLTLSVLPLINTTMEDTPGQWVNDVRLWNRATTQWDIVYRRRSDRR